MMIRFLLTAVVGIAVTAAASIADASIFANSYLNISDFRIINTATGNPVEDGVDITVTGVSANSSTFATLIGFGSTGFIPTAGSLDATPAYFSSTGGAYVNNTVFGSLPTTPGNPAGLLHGATEHYALSDTDTDGGSAITPNGGPQTPGVEVESFAEISVDEGNLPVALGDTAGTVTGGASFNFTVLGGTLSLQLDFNALLDIILDYSQAPPPAGLGLIASSSFGATLTGSGSISVGGVATPIFSYDPAALNVMNLTNNVPGTVVQQQVSGPFQSPIVTLGPGTYTFALTQSNAAALQNVVPEPAAIAAWALLTISAGGACAYNRRRKCQ